MAEHRTLSASAADRAYHVRKGTCRDLYLAGRVRGQQRPGKGRTGYVLRLRVDDLDDVLAGGSDRIPRLRRRTA